MQRWLLAKTRFQGLRRLSVSDMLAQESWHQLESYLTTMRGEGGASLFAEPVQGVDGSIHWYAPGEEAPVPASSLPPDAHAKLLENLKEEHANLTAVAKQLLEDTRAPQRRLGAFVEAALEFATSTDGEEPLYSVDGRPVLVNWGTRLDVPEPPTNPLQDYVERTRRRAPPPVETAAPVAPPVTPPGDPPVQRVAVSYFPFDWFAPLLWLLLALLVATLFFMLLAPCGITWLTGARSCPGAIIEVRERGNDLQAEIDMLEAQLLRAPDCVDEFAERRESLGAKTGDVEITLVWDDLADLDLSVVCPGSESIYFDKRQACGGELDIDKNRTAAEATATGAVEHIVFAKAPDGSGFKVKVHKYVSHQNTTPWYKPGPVPFRVEVRRGDEVEVFDGVVTDDQRVVVKEF